MHFMWKCPLLLFANVHCALAELAMPTMSVCSTLVDSKQCAPCLLLACAANADCQGTQATSPVNDINTINRTPAGIDVQGRVKWAMAGRSKSKLEQVKQDLANSYPGCEKVSRVQLGE